LLPFRGSHQNHRRSESMARLHTAAYSAPQKDHVMPTHVSIAWTSFIIEEYS
jgi:hypothetical protein